MAAMHAIGPKDRKGSTGCPVSGPENPRITHGLSAERSRVSGWAGSRRASIRARPVATAFPQPANASLGVGTPAVAESNPIVACH